jgi:hypothetical protein
MIEDIAKLAAAWTAAVERGYVAAATGRPIARWDGIVPDEHIDAMAFAAAGAVAARFLAVGTPRRIGVIGDDASVLLCAAALGTWFAPVEVALSISADIVFVASPTWIAAGKIARGTHLNLAADAAPAVELDPSWTVVDETGLGRIAAGFDDGRQLDEISVFLAGELAVARQVLKG